VNATQRNATQRYKTALNDPGLTKSLGLLGYLGSTLALIGCAEMPDTSSVSAITIADDARSPDASLGIELPRTAPTTELDSRGRQRRPRWPRNFGEIFAAERAHLGLIVVKVVDGAGLRLRRGVVTDVSRSVGLDAERLSEFGVREAEIPRHAESLRALLATIEGATVTSLISEDLESWHDTNRERNETRLRQQFEDRTSFWFIARRGMSETETRDVLARLRRHPLIEYAYVQPQGSPPRSAPACTDQLPGTTPSLAVLETYQQAPPSGSQFAGLAPDATQPHWVGYHVCSHRHRRRGRRGGRDGRREWIRRRARRPAFR
jgi:hypothetical protein